MGKGLGTPSREMAASLMLGARKRKVTRLSEWTSGEISGGGDWACAGAVAARSRRASAKKVRFMIPRCGAFNRRPDPKCARGGMIQQTTVRRAKPRPYKQRPA